MVGQGVETTDRGREGMRPRLDDDVMVEELMKAMGCLAVVMLAFLLVDEFVDMVWRRR